MLAALIAVAAVANLGLAVANVALPSIGTHFDASQTALTWLLLAQYAAEEAEETEEKAVAIEDELGHRRGVGCGVARWT